MTTRPCTKLFTSGLSIFLIGAILNFHTDLNTLSHVLLGLGACLSLPGAFMTMAEVERVRIR